MGNRILLVCCLAAVCLLCCGCPPGQPPPDDGQVERYYGGLDGPAQLEGGGQLLLDGDVLWRLDANGIKVSEQLIPAQDSAGPIGGGFEWKMKSRGTETYLQQDYYWISRLNANGSLAWSNRFKTAVSWFEPLPGGGVAVYWKAGGTSNDDRLQVVNAAGKELWGRSFKFGSYISPRLGGEGQIYITSSQSLLCLDSSSGNTLWEIPAGNNAAMILDANAEGLLASGSALAAYNTDGSLRWLAPSVMVSGPYSGLLLADGGAAVLAPGQLATYQLDLYGPDGQLRESYIPPQSAQINQICLLDDARLALTSYDSSAYSLKLISLTDASELWSLPLLPDSSLPATPVLEEFIYGSELHLGPDGLIWVQQGKVLYGVDEHGALQRSYTAARYFERTYLNGEWH